MTESSKRRIIVSSAAKLDPISDAARLRKMIALTEEWKGRAWDFFDLVGEVKDVGGFIANCLARIRFYPADVADDPDESPPPTEDGVAIAAWNRIHNHAAIQRKFGFQAFVTGDSYLVGIVAGHPKLSNDEERWLLCSVSEIQARDKETSAKVDGAWVTLREEDFIARIWQEHPREAMEADSTVRGVLESCDTLVAVDQTIKAIVRSRAVNGNLVVLPDDMTIGSLDPNDEEGDGEEDDVLDTLIKTYTTPARTPGTAAEVCPVFMTFPRSEVGEKSGVEIFELKRPFDEMFDKTTDRALRRLAQGLNINVERVFGLGGVTGLTGNSGQIAESDYRDHVEPYAQVWAEGLAEVLLRPAVKAAGGDPRLVTVGYDASKLVVRSDKQTSVDYGHENNIINDDTWLQVKGYTTDDKLTPEELRQRLLITQAKAGLVSADDAANNRVVDPIRRTERGEDPNAPPITAAVMSMSPRRGGVGTRLAQVDRECRLRVREAAEAALTRAEERASSRIVGRLRADSTMRDLIRGVEKREVAQLVGEETLTRFGMSVDESVAGEFEDLRARVTGFAADAWTATAGALTVSEEQLPADRQAWAEHAADVLVRRLRDLTAQRLRGAALATDQGEADLSTTVPMSFAREFVARAGGQTARHGVTAGLIQRLTDWVSGGIATGAETLGIASTEVNLVRVGYVWDYGLGARAIFEPHLDLDGSEFQSFDELENTESFPDSPYFFPGDHDGCGCDAIPVLEEQVYSGSDVQGDIVAEDEEALVAGIA